ncbi:hypothetical protein JL721_12371 [Aureococcus anophagefferens]|nr:hypothetical protein JL721_12371 [Aureococcus anophagefferens]
MIERADRRARKPPPPPVPAKPTASGADGQFDGVRYNDEGSRSRGAASRNSAWAQTLAETTVTVDAPPGTRSKDVTCKITAGRISLRIAGVDDVLEGELYDKIKDDDSMWTLDHADDGRAAVVLTFEKTRETWWRSVLRTPKRDMIDAAQVDSSKKIDEYDEKTQGAIRKIMFDQRQKQRAKTSDEMKMDAISTAEPARSRSWTPRAFHNAPNPKLQGPNVAVRSQGVDVAGGAGRAAAGAAGSVPGAPSSGVASAAGTGRGAFRARPRWGAGRRHHAPPRPALVARASSVARERCVSRGS